jgi:2-aminoethylphosphonate-pyruvate transaminase
VDAVASFGGEKLDLGLIDIVASSANKCLEGVPGIAFVLSRHDVQFNPRSFYLDLTKYDQSVPFTPAVHTHYALNAALEVYEREGGITARMERYGRLSTQIRKGLKALGLELCLKEEYYSRILTSAYLPEELNYDTLHDELKKQGYVIYTGKGSLGDRGFRLANMGQITTEDINGLLDAIGELV